MNLYPNRRNGPDYDQNRALRVTVVNGSEENGGESGTLSSVPVSPVGQAPLYGADATGGDECIYTSPAAAAGKRWALYGYELSLSDNPAAAVTFTRDIGGVSTTQSITTGGITGPLTLPAPLLSDTAGTFTLSISAPGGDIITNITPFAVQVPA